jgi:hypothetical protein
MILAKMGTTMSENQNTNSTDSCAEFLDLLPLYEGGELELDKADRLRTHLGSCIVCSAQWVVGKNAIVMRQEAWAIQAGEAPDLWPGIQARLRAEGDLKVELPVTLLERGILLRFPVLRYAAAAAAVVALLAVGSQFMGAGQDSPVVPNGNQLVAEGMRLETQINTQVPAPEIAFVAPALNKLRLVGSDATSVLDEAPPWGLEEAHSGDARRRNESMEVAGWR